ncbi:unnamed protein product [Ostreobium quekettii]|uniref:5-methyltetrahydropteroyltriglutamate--homocysteine S-methyltransferase n=1 Tax=Ostreobium quekettii TaxID=121088 RepID=A0A8S1ISY0_9CHLO|nr:unnamed protein product [Ostreobium quekettii]
MGFPTSTIGFPRMGRNRDLKRALESYWKGNSTAEELVAVSNEVQKKAWAAQKDAGVSLIGLDGTLYDQMLDWTFYLGLAPPRFQHLTALDQYFAMARGAEGTPALDMSKFFDTNYHFMVPELDDASEPKPDFSLLLEKVKRGQEVVGSDCAVPIVIGPVSFVHLANCKADASSMICKLVPAYKQLLSELKGLGVPEVQMHEPALVFGNANDFKDSCEAAYKELASAGMSINLVTYYDDMKEDVFAWVTKLPVCAISMDFCGVPGVELGNETMEMIKKHGFPKDKRLGAGVVDGRSVWGSEGSAAKALSELQALGITNICVQSSVSLQHLPYTLEDEKALPEDVKGRLAFAVEKLAEIVKVACGGVPESATVLGSTKVEVDAKLFDRPLPFAERRSKQICTPAFPTSTIGSFPQTSAIRSVRMKFKKGEVSAEEYKCQMTGHIAYAIGVQEALGLDVFVHGEAERTDMVEYFGQKLEGMYFTNNGWVQSYGSRCIRPPVIVGDVHRREAMTIVEYKIAQSLTKKPVKGMLTGPVTILNWSFPRKDISRKAQAMQLALALREEVKDLEEAGCKVIQVDEPAIREGLPLKKARWDSYLSWAVDAFRLCCGVAAPETQIVTHMCYSDFQDILEAIDRMDADVLTIENSRSGNEMIHALATYGYGRDLGAGVYDVHSPVVPTVDFITSKIRSFMESRVLEGHADRIWVNPDCGLKTRDWKEVLPALKNMVEAARVMREEIAAN